MFKIKFRPFTFMVVPQDSKRVLKLTVPFYGVVAAGAVLLVIAVMIFFILSDYVYIMSEFHSVEQMKERNRKLGKQLYSYKVKIQEIENTMERLKALTTKLKIVSNIGGGSDGLDEDMYSEDDMIEGIDDLSMSSNEEIDSQFRSAQTRLMDVENKLTYQEEELTKLGEYFAEQSALLASTPSIIPVKGWITSGFGPRIDPFTRKIVRHDGIDISTRSGTPIVAPADGVVTFAGNKPGYGLMLSIDHGYGIVTKYGHNSKFFVAHGTRVKRGMPISAVGSTGRSTGPHLHYEVVINGINVNPKKFIMDNPWE